MMNKLEKEIKFIEIKYSNLILFLISLVVVMILIDPHYFRFISDFISKLGDYGLLGIFLAGIGYTSAFTSPISAIIVYTFGNYYNPMLIAALGAFGSLIADLVFYFISRKIIRNPRKLNIAKIPQHKLIKKLAPAIGFFIIASPLPDELGAAFLSVFEKDYRIFALISYIANFTGILTFAIFGSL